MRRIVRSSQKTRSRLLRDDGIPVKNLAHLGLPNNRSFLDAGLKQQKYTERKCHTTVGGQAVALLLQNARLHN